MPKSAVKSKGKMGGASAPPSASSPKQKKALTPEKALEKITSSGNRQFGDGTFLSMDGDPARIKKRYSTGLAPLDIALTGEVGSGLPDGRLVAIYGAETVGKTTLACMLMRVMQEAGGLVFVLDSEGRLTKDRLEALGVSPVGFRWVDEKFLEPALDQIIKLLKELRDVPFIFALDTIASINSIKERARSVSDNSQTSVHSLSLSKGMRYIADNIKRSKAIILFINQLKTGAIGNAFATEREKDAMLGGKPIRFHSDVILKMEYSRKFYLMIKGEKVQRGFEIRVKTDKNSGFVDGVRLRLVFTTYNGAKFDDALSCLATMRDWKIIPAGNDSGSAISFNGSKYSIKQWRNLYASDEVFRKSIHDALKTKFHTKYKPEEKVV